MSGHWWVYGKYKVSYLTLYLLKKPISWEWRFSGSSSTNWLLHYVIFYATLTIIHIEISHKLQYTILLPSFSSGKASLRHSQSSLLHTLSRITKHFNILSFIVKKIKIKTSFFQLFPHFLDNQTKLRQTKLQKMKTFSTTFSPFKKFFLKTSISWTFPHCLSVTKHNHKNYLAPDQ